MFGIKKRIKPSFFILGAQKAATTSVFHYIIQHPDVICPSKKEFNFFSLDDNYEKGIEDYLLSFPRKKIKLFHTYYSFEATPEYLYYPYVPERIFKSFPNAKLIILLREPVQRAFSAWNMYKQLEPHFRKLAYEYKRDGKTDNLITAFYSKRHFPTFKEAIEIEQNILNSGSSFIEPSLIRRGFYDIQLVNYFKFFERDQILILNYHQFIDNPVKGIEEIAAFLKLPAKNWGDVNLKPENSRSYNDIIVKETYDMLTTSFKPHNENLFTILKTKPWW